MPWYHPSTAPSVTAMLTNFVRPFVISYNKSMSLSQMLYKSGAWTKRLLQDLNYSTWGFPTSLPLPSVLGLCCIGSTRSGKNVTQKALQKYAVNQTQGVRFHADIMNTGNTAPGYDKLSFKIIESECLTPYHPGQSLEPFQWYSMIH